MVAAAEVVVVLVMEAVAEMARQFWLHVLVNCHHGATHSYSRANGLFCLACYCYAFCTVFWKATQPESLVVGYLPIAGQGVFVVHPITKTGLNSLYTQVFHDSGRLMLLSFS